MMTTLMMSPRILGWICSAVAVVAAVAPVAAAAAADAAAAAAAVGSPRAFG